MIDPTIVAIASNVLAAITPYLPKIAEKTAEKVGEEIPSGVGKLWKRISERLSKKASGKEAIDDAVRSPSDSDAHSALRLQIRKEIEADPMFREELLSMLNELPKSGTGIWQQGVGNIAIQGSSNTVTQNIGQVANSITNVGYQPRQIPENRVAEFVAQMRPFAGEKIDISASATDSKTHFLANQLTDLLNQAGWTAFGDSVSVMDLPKYVHVIVPERLRDSVALDKLARFLHSCSFKLQLNIAPNDSSQMIQIFVNGVD